MKTCYNCKEIKSLSDFHRNKTKKDGRTGTCKVCRIIIHKEHYEANKPAYIDKAKLLKQILRAEVDKIKETTPCADCGEYFQACQMDFDHINNDKEASIAILVRDGKRKKVFKEIEKCEVVCSNDHRLRTYNRYKTANIV